MPTSGLTAFIPSHMGEIERFAAEGRRPAGAPERKISITPLIRC